jgi:hypothetical protein
MDFFVHNACCQILSNEKNYKSKKGEDKNSPTKGP